MMFLFFVERAVISRVILVWIFGEDILMFWSWFFCFSLMMVVWCGL